MGIFSTSSPFDADVEKATDEKNTNEEWGLIMDICDRVNGNQQHAKDCLRSIIKRLGHQDPHIVLHAITLLDACVSNCGKVFHLEVASREFETEFRKILSKCNPGVANKLKQLLRSWAEGDFKSDPQLNLIPSLYNKLKMEGLDFSKPASSSKGQKSSSLPKDPNAVVSQQEVDDLAKAIALSLKDSESPKSPKSKSATSNTTSLYPSTSLNSSSTLATDGRKVRALYDFEAAEDNELTFKAGEIIFVTDDGDPNWWKGNNKRGEGLFPSSFVTADLSAEPENLKNESSKKSVQFNDSVSVESIKKDPLEVEINEAKMDRLLHYLHEADPRDDSGDPSDMFELEDEVNAMGPLIDSELERIDTKHAQLTQLSSDLVEALKLYHSLMRDTNTQGMNYQQQQQQQQQQQTLSKQQYGGGYMMIQPGQFNGPGPSSVPYVPTYVNSGGNLHLQNGPHSVQAFVPEQQGSMPHMNGGVPYGPTPGNLPPYHMQGPPLPPQIAPQQPQQQQQQQQPPPQQTQLPGVHSRYQNNSDNNPPPLL